MIKLSVLYFKKQMWYHVVYKSTLQTVQNERQYIYNKVTVECYCLLIAGILFPVRNVSYFHVSDKIRFSCSDKNTFVPSASTDYISLHFINVFLLKAKKCFTNCQITLLCISGKYKVSVIDAKCYIKIAYLITNIMNNRASLHNTIFNKLSKSMNNIN